MRREALRQQRLPRGVAAQRRGRRRVVELVRLQMRWCAFRCAIRSPPRGGTCTPAGHDGVLSDVPIDHRRVVELICLQEMMCFQMTH